MKNYSKTNLNFYNTERHNLNKLYSLNSPNQERENNTKPIINENIKQEDILIPSEVETYLNVKKNIFYINKKFYSLQMIGKMLMILLE